MPHLAIWKVLVEMEYPSQGWRWQPPKLGRLLWQLIVILTGCKSCPIVIIFKNHLGARSLAGWASVKFLTFPNMCGQSPVANWYQLPFWQPVHGSSKWANYCPFWPESSKQVWGVLAARVQGKLCRKAVFSLGFDFISRSTLKNAAEEGQNKETRP